MEIVPEWINLAEFYNNYNDVRQYNDFSAARSHYDNLLLTACDADKTSVTTLPRYVTSTLRNVMLFGDPVVIGHPEVSKRI